jgi:hypothetical protein
VRIARWATYYALSHSLYGEDADVKMQERRSYHMAVATGVVFFALRACSR